MSYTIHDGLSIKQKQTFNVRLYCKCGGEYTYDYNTSGYGDLFGAMLNNIQREKGQTEEKYKYVHKCDKCGDVKKFVNIYPLGRDYEVGILTPHDMIVEHISKDMGEIIKEDIHTLEFDITPEFEDMETK